MRRFYGVAACCLVLTLSPALVASEHPNIARGFDIGRTYQMNGIDDVNLFNGSLTATIPIGQRYHVNGGLQYGLTLVYSGMLWDTVQDEAAPFNHTSYPNRRSNAGMGWLLSLGRLLPPNQFPQQEAFDWSYEGTDGAIHQFVCSGLNISCTDTSPNFYTQDGSFLRLHISGSGRTVEFPDGTSQVFQEMDMSASPWSLQPGSGVWRLTAINDRFGNSVSIVYDSTTAYPEIWKINDGTRMQTVYFAAATAPGEADDFYDVALDHVVLTTFGNPAEASRTWTMSYSKQLLGSGNPPGRGSNFNQYTVPLLISVTLPPAGNAQQVYSMRFTDGTPYYHISTISDMSNGALLGLQLPTKGWIEWAYVVYTFPAATDVAISRSLAVTQRRALTPDRNHVDTWLYDRKESAGRMCTDTNNVGYTYPSDQLVVSVTSPEQVTTMHYYSIYQPPQNSIPCASGTINFDENEYALPFTRGVSDSPNGEQRYLSQETYTGTPSILTTPPTYRVTGGVRQRSEWAYYRSTWVRSMSIISRNQAIRPSTTTTRIADRDTRPPASPPSRDSVLTEPVIIGSPRPTAISLPAISPPRSRTMPVPFRPATPGC